MPNTKDSVVGQAKENQFIEYITDPESPTFMNQTASFKRINPNANGSAQPRSSELMSRPDIQEKFLISMKRYGLCDDGANQVHSKIMYEGEESNRLKAVKMYHELMGRYSVNVGKLADTIATQVNIIVHKPNEHKDLDT